jgi:TetR/AcrR family transcriptional repressor of nem operon
MVEDPKRPRRPQQRKAETHERILREAAAAIRIDGADRASVSTIMSRAGLTVGGFYAHFSSKDDLLAKAVDYMFQDRYAAFLERLDDTDVATTLTRFIDTYLSMRHRDAVERGCPIPALAGEIGRLAEPVRDAFTRGIEALETAVEDLLARLGREDAAILSHSLIAEMTGSISLARAQPDVAKAESMLSASRDHVRERIGL